jgi:hypothetical protein
MYFADSLRYTIVANDFDLTSGEMRSERVFATTHAPAFPDGSAVDAEGYLWNAEFNGSRVVRYAPDGRIDRVIELPMRRPTCCAFGGDTLDVLYITTASQRLIGRTCATPEYAFHALTRELEVLVLQTGEAGPIAAVIAGIDIAMWDLTARKRNIPLHRALGAEASETVPAYATGINPDEPERHARGAGRRRRDIGSRTSRAPA